MSAGSRTNPGGYASAPESLEQFAIDDERSPADVAAFLAQPRLRAVWKDWDRHLRRTRDPDPFWNR